MTWQRIDDDTYIDNTLVTCVEYQLFIDEMREQGKYYQPDHWTSYQFPNGHAHEPILGVRHSDAVAFCGWLTKREGKEWKFRLLIQIEANSFPIKPLAKSTLGYWIDEDYKFVWIGLAPVNARVLDQDRANDLYRYHELDSAVDRERDHAHAIKRALDRNHKRAIKRSLDLDHVIVHNLDLMLDHVISQDFDLALNHARTRALNLTLDHVPDQHLDLDRALVIYMDIVTLQERIAGRSPAFEGIRLVKERIK